MSVINTIKHLRSLGKSEEEIARTLDGTYNGVFSEAIKQGLTIDELGSSLDQKDQTPEHNVIEPSTANVVSNRGIADDLVEPTIVPQHPKTRAELYKEKVASKIKQQKQRTSTATPYNPERVDQYNDIINRASQKYSIHPALIKAVIWQESRGNPNAVSAANAEGLMQIIPSTQKHMGINNPFDPEQSIMGGTKYLKEMLNRYGGNVALALAAYNSGPGNVDKHKGIPPLPETQDYVKKIYGKGGWYRQFYDRQAGEQVVSTGVVMDNVGGLRRPSDQQTAEQDIRKELADEYEAKLRAELSRPIKVDGEWAIQHGEGGEIVKTGMRVGDNPGKDIGELAKQYPEIMRNVAYRDAPRYVQHFLRGIETIAKMPATLIKMYNETVHETAEESLNLIKQQLETHSLQPDTYHKDKKTKHKLQNKVAILEQKIKMAKKSVGEVNSFLDQHKNIEVITSPGLQGYLENIVGMAPQMAAQYGLGAIPVVGAALSPTFMFGTIAAGSYEELRGDNEKFLRDLSGLVGTDNDADIGKLARVVMYDKTDVGTEARKIVQEAGVKIPVRATEATVASMINAIIQTPLEEAGRLAGMGPLGTKIGGLVSKVGLGKRATYVLGKVIQGGLGEYITESIQKHPEEITHRWAEAQMSGESFAEVRDKYIEDIGSILVAGHTEGMVAAFYGSLFGSMSATASDLDIDLEGLVQNKLQGNKQKVSEVIKPKQIQDTEPSTKQLDISSYLSVYNDLDKAKQQDFMDALPGNIKQAIEESLKEPTTELSTELSTDIKYIKDIQNKIGEQLDNNIIDKGTYDEILQLYKDGWTIATTDKDGATILEKTNNDGDTRTITLAPPPTTQPDVSTKPVETPKTKSDTTTPPVDSEVPKTQETPTKQRVVVRKKAETISEPVSSAAPVDPKTIASDLGIKYKGSWIIPETNTNQEIYQVEIDGEMADMYVPVGSTTEVVRTELEATKKAFDNAKTDVDATVDSNVPVSPVEPPKSTEGTTTTAKPIVPPSTQETALNEGASIATKLGIEYRGETTNKETGQQQDVYIANLGDENVEFRVPRGSTEKVVGKELSVVQQDMDVSIPESVYETIKKRITKNFGKRKPDPFYTDKTIEEMREFLSNPEGQVRLSQDAINELSDNTIKHIQDILSRTQGGAGKVFRQTLGYITKATEQQALNRQTKQRRGKTQDKVEFLTNVRDNLVEYNPDDATQKEYLRQRLITTKKLGDKKYIYLTTSDMTSDKTMSSPLRRSGEYVLQSLIDQTTGDRMSVEDAESYEAEQQRELGYDYKLDNTNPTVVAAIQRFKQLAKDKKIAFKTVDGLYQTMAGLDFSLFSSKKEYLAHLDMVSKLDAMRPAQSSANIKHNTKNLSSSIDKYVANGSIGRKQGNAMKAIVQAIGENIDFNIDIQDTDGAFYKLSENIIKLSKKKLYNFAHEVGHFVYHNVLTAQQRAQYNQDIVNKYWNSDAASVDYDAMSKNISAHTTFLEMFSKATSIHGKDIDNTVDSPGEYFAEQVAQYVHNNVLSDTEHKSLIERAKEIVVRAFNNMRNMFHIDPVVLPYVESVFALDAAERFANTNEAKKLLDKIGDRFDDTPLFEDIFDAKQTKFDAGVYEEAYKLVHRVANRAAIERESNIQEARKQVVQYIIDNVNRADLRKNLLHTVTSKEIKSIDDKGFRHAINVVDKLVEMGGKRRAIKDIKKALRGVDLNRLPPQSRDQVKQLLGQYDLSKMLTNTKEKLEAYEATLYNTAFVDAATKADINSKISRLGKVALLDLDANKLAEVKHNIVSAIQQGKQEIVQLRKHNKTLREQRAFEVTQSINENLANKQHQKHGKQLKKLFNKLQGQTQETQEKIIAQLPEDMQAAIKGVAHKVPNGAIKDFAKMIESNLPNLQYFCNQLDGFEKGSMTQHVFDELHNGNTTRKTLQQKMEDFFQNEIRNANIDLSGWSELEFQGIISDVLNEKKRFVHTTSWQLENGDIIPLTKMEKLNIYRCAKREQGVRHILHGGLRRTKTSLFKTKKHFSNISLNDIIALFDSMTDEELKMSDIFDRWFALQKNDINTHSTDMFGYELISSDETDYTPIRINSVDVQKDIEMSRTIGALNKYPSSVLPGVLKKITPRAKQGLIIEDAFAAMARHHTLVAKWIGMAKPIETVGNLLNDIRPTMDELGLNREFVQIQSSYETENSIDNSVFRDGFVPQIIRGFVKLQIVGRLGYNLGVQAIQPASALCFFVDDSLSANADIAKYIIKKHGVRDMLRRLSDANPNLRDRFEGNVSRDIREHFQDALGRKVILSTLNKHGAKETLKRLVSTEGAMHGLTKMDANAIAFGGFLYQNKLIQEGSWGKPGEQKFDEELGRRVWDATVISQPVFDSIYRGAAHRSKALWPFTQFSSQRAQNYIMTKRALAKLNKGNVAGGIKDLIIIHALQPAFLMAIGEAWKMARGKSKPEKWKDPLYWLKQWGMIEAGNLLVVGGGLVALIGGTEVSAGAYSSLFRDLREMHKAATKDSVDPEKVWRAFVRFVGNAGIPLQGLQNNVDAVSNIAQKIVEETNDE